MIWNEDLESKILAQIEATPDAEIILPDWCYWRGEDQPWIYIDQRPVRLIRHLRESLIGRIPEGAGLALLPGVDPRNVNPHLAAITPTRRARAACPNGHIYTEDDWVERLRQHRCQTCRAARLIGGSPSEAHRQKTHCPQGHPYDADNLVKLKSGRRRCKACHRQQQAWYRAGKTKPTTEGSQA